MTFPQPYAFKFSPFLPTLIGFNPFSPRRLHPLPSPRHHSRRAHTVQLSQQRLSLRHYATLSPLPRRNVNRRDTNILEVSNYNNISTLIRNELTDFFSNPDWLQSQAPQDRGASTPTTSPVTNSQAPPRLERTTSADNIFNPNNDAWDLLVPTSLEQTCRKASS